MRTPIDTRPCRSLEQAIFERRVGLRVNTTIAVEDRPTDEVPAQQGDGQVRYQTKLSERLLQIVLRILVRQ